MAWESMAPLLLANNGFGVGVSGGKIYTLGGQQNTTGTYEYDPATDAWAAKATMPTYHFYHQAATDSSGNIFIVKQDDSNEIRKYVPSTNTWSDITDSAAAWDGTAGRFNWFVGDGSGNIYQGGGISRTDVNRWAGSAATPTWTNALTTITPWAGTPYTGTSAVYYPPNGKIYLMGGREWSTGNPNPVMAEYEPPSTWVTKTSPPYDLDEPFLVAVPPYIYIIPGSFDPENIEILRYDPAADSYSTWIDLPYSAYRRGAAFIAPYLHVFGGSRLSDAVSLNSHYRTELPGTGYFMGAESDSFIDPGFTGSDSFDSVFPDDDLYPAEDLYPESG